MLPALLLVATAAAIPPDLGEWDMLVEGRDWIGCQTVGELPWCRSVATIPGPMIKIHSLLNDFAGYPSFMDRVSETRVYSEGIVHIVLDMPFPFAHRDYVVKYTKSKDGDAIVFDFKATHHPSATAVDGSVRLPRAEGQWRLEAVGPGATRVTYTWCGELLGDFPSWALPTAWETQGAEVMNWLKEAL